MDYRAALGRSANNKGELSMATSEKQPDLKQFIEDPAFEGDRTIMRGYMRHVLEQEYNATKQRREKNEAPAGIFDAIFGWFGAGSEEHENVFDRAFSFTRRNVKK